MQHESSQTTVYFFAEGLMGCHVGRAPESPSLELLGRREDLASRDGVEQFTSATALHARDAQYSLVSSRRHVHLTNGQRQQ